VFPPDHFHLDFHRIRQLGEQLVRKSYSFGAMSIKRLRAIKEGRESPLAIEAGVIRLIDEGVETMLRVAGTIETVLRSRQRKTLRSQDLPVSDPVIVMGRDFALPDGGMEVQSEGLLRGRPLAEVLEWVVRLSYSVAVMFHHQKTVGALGREERLNRETVRVVGELQRLADPRTLRELREYVPAQSTSQSVVSST